MSLNLEGLTKTELEILLFLVVTKSMFDSNRKRIDDFLPEFNGVVYGRDDMRKMIGNLIELKILKEKPVLKGYSYSIGGKAHENYDVEFGIADKTIYNGLKEHFSGQILIATWKVRIKKIIVWIFDNLITILIAVITSVIVTYISLKYFGK